MPMKSTDEARVTPRQHKKPCDDCPFRRNAIPGWLGGYTPRQFTLMAHGDSRMFCHTLKRDKENWHECAGAAIYRANVCKSPRLDASGKVPLALPADKKVLSWDFEKYHESVGEKEE